MIDDGLKDWSGHNASYALSVLDEFNRRGLTCELFANRDIERVHGERVNVHPSFRNFAAGLFFEWRCLPSEANRLARALAANCSHIRDLLGELTSHVRTGDVILVLIASSRTTLAYAIWLLWLSFRGRRVNIVFVLHNSPLKSFRWDARLLEKAGSGHRVFWAAHTDPVRKACADISGHESFLLPLPFGAKSGVQSSRPAEDTRVVFSYLGVALVPKGLDVLVHAIDGVADLLKSGRLRLVVQCNIHRADPQLQELSQELGALARRLPGIEVIAGAFTATEYQQKMSDSDLLLIPHRRQFYKSALSGIFTEALAMGKPVIVASDTYMADELKHYGSGLCFEDGDPIALAEAMRKAMGDIQKLRHRALEAQSAWQAIHNAERYVTELSAIVNGAGEIPGHAD
jgi:glycosyltransferase involved in cell wall biosynthesis